MTDFKKGRLDDWFDKQDFNTLEELMYKAYEEFPFFEETGYILHLYMEMDKSRTE
jgi:hypothetical protein